MEETVNTPETSIALLGLILLVASIVGILSRRLRLPYSAGLMAAGIALGFLPIGIELPLSRELIFNVFLPPLIFEAALHLRWKPFRRNLPLTLTLAFAGVTISTVIIATGMHIFLQWSWLGAGLFGVLIAATDPVSVVAAFKEMNVSPRLRIIVESESLLNDGAAAVGFGILLAVAAGGATAAGDIAFSFIWMAAGGVIVGAVIAGVVLALAGRTQDHLIEITLTTITAYASFMFAEHFGMSGVLASLSAGLVVGNVGWLGPIAHESRKHVLSFWEYTAFLANSIVFILIGRHLADQPFALFSAAVAVSIILVLAGRVITVYPLSWLFSRSSLKMEPGYQHVLVWGGLRGALALALALALPENIPERQDIIVISFAVVAFSIFVQGLTMPMLVRHLGLSGGQSDSEKQQD